VVAQPKTEPFITEELAEITKDLEGVIHDPHSLPQELREMPVWLKVTLNERNQWKQPFWYKDNEKIYKWSQLATSQRELDEVLEQQPAGKAGFHARDRLCVIDLDDVIDRVTRQLKEPKILELLNTLKASVYLSSSGTGLHIPFRLQEGVDIDPPSKNLSFRLTEGKTGEFLGGKFPSFVAFTGVAVPRYDYGWLVEITQAEWNYIREFLWSVETIDRHTEPSEPTQLLTPVSTPQARAPREREPKESPFGIQWEPYYRTRVKDLVNWVRPLNMKDTSHSGWNRYLLRAYVLGAVSPDVDEARNLSHRFEGYFNNNAPPGLWYQRSNHPPIWHLEQVLRAYQYGFETKRLVRVDKGEKYGVTPAEKQFVQLAKHIASSDMKPSSKAIFESIVMEANGRDSVRVYNHQLADLSGFSETTVKRAKKELSRHNCLEINMNLYTIKPDQSCR